MRQNAKCDETSASTKEHSREITQLCGFAESFDFTIKRHSSARGTPEYQRDSYKHFRFVFGRIPTEQCFRFSVVLILFCSCSCSIELEENNGILASREHNKNR